MADRVLIVEDDADVATFEKMILERAGYEVKVATTGAAGLETAPAFKPAVVLLDVDSHRGGCARAVERVLALELDCKLVLLCTEITEEIGHKS